MRNFKPEILVVIGITLTFILITFLQIQTSSNLLHQTVIRKGLFPSTETFRYNKKIRAWQGNKGTTALYISALRSWSHMGVKVTRLPAEGM